MLFLSFLLTYHLQVVYYLCSYDRYLLSTGTYCFNSVLTIIVSQGFVQEGGSHGIPPPPQGCFTLSRICHIYFLFLWLFKLKFNAPTHAYIVQYCIEHKRSIDRISTHKVQILYELLVFVIIAFILVIVKFSWFQKTYS